jgi:hypothetical protein
VTDEAAVPVVISTEVLLGEMTDFDGPGGSASVIDVSHLLSTRKEKRMGLADEGQFTCNVNFLPGDRGQTLMRDDRAARSEQVFRLHLTDEDDSYLEFHAFVLGFAISGGVDAKVNGKLTLEITAEVTQETAA